MRTLYMKDQKMTLLNRFYTFISGLGNGDGIFKYRRPKSRKVLMTSDRTGTHKETHVLLTRYAFY